MVIQTNPSSMSGRLICRLQWIAAQLNFQLPKIILKLPESNSLKNSDFNRADVPETPNNSQPNLFTRSYVPNPLTGRNPLLGSLNSPQTKTILLLPAVVIQGVILQRPEKTYLGGCISMTSAAMPLFGKCH